MPLQEILRPNPSRAMKLESQLSMGVGAGWGLRRGRPTSVERRAAIQQARAPWPSNAYCSASRSDQRTQVSSASIFSQRASTAIADTMNEFTTAICWKQSAVEPDAPWSIAITQLSDRPLISNMGTANRLRRTDDPE